MIQMIGITAGIIPISFFWLIGDIIVFYFEKSILEEQSMIYIIRKFWLLLKPWLNSTY